MFFGVGVDMRNIAFKGKEEMIGFGSDKISAFPENLEVKSGRTGFAPVKTRH